MSDPFRFDVAFSFLAHDLAAAEQLANLLSPGLRVFLYSRQQETLLGADGMEQFGKVFGQETRVAVILYRGASKGAPGWGRTDWTAFEERHIQARALRSHMTSFMLVKFDDTPPPDWVPPFYIYADARVDSPESIAGAVRAKAREQGAVVMVESTIDAVRRERREASARKAREERERSLESVAEVRNEVELLFRDIRHLADELRSGPEPIDIRFEWYEGRGTIVSKFSTSLVWQQRFYSHIGDSQIRVVEWAERLLPPGPNNPHGGGGRQMPVGVMHFAPKLSDSDEWVWQHRFVRIPDDPQPIILHNPNALFRTTELGEAIVRRHCDRLLSF